MLNDSASAELLTAQGLTKVHVQRRPFWRQVHRVTALEDVHLKLLAGATLGLVGTSGSGKSTLALCLAGLEQPTSGKVIFAGEDIFSLKSAELLRFRQSVQLVLQDSATALNPRLSVLEIVTEPLRIGRIDSPERQRAKASELMRQLELPDAVLERRPGELSGGQRQRVAIARALTLEPRVLILDEVLTGLDIPVQQQFLALLRQLKLKRSFATLFISHDLRLVRAISDRLAVMHAGKIVEEGRTRDLFANPQHAHTRALLVAMPLRRVPCLAAGGN